MKDYMFIYKGMDPKWASASAEDKQAVMAKWGAWMERLGKAGQLVTGGAPLEYDGRRLKKDGVLTDIAASEVKELVSGYSIVRAESYEQAAALASDCPIFSHANSLIEIRAIAPM